MNLITKIISKEWIKTFIYSAASLFILISVAELISGFLRSSVTAKDVMINYFLNLPIQFSRVFPLSCLLASLFGMNKLKGKSELIAIFASGFSRKRFFITITFLASFVAFIQFINSSYFQPYTNKLRPTLIADSGSKFKKTKSKGLVRSALDSGKVWYKSEDYFLAFSGYDKRLKQLKNISIFSFNQFSKIESVIRANSADYIGDNNWLLNDSGQVINLGELGFPKLETSKQMPMVLHEGPADFNNIESDISTLSIFNLYRFIMRLKSSGISTVEYEILLYEKFSVPLICIIFALFASRTIFTPNRRNSSFGKNVLTAFLFIVFYYIVYASFMALGNSGKLHPILATFAIPILLGSYISVDFFRKRKL